MKANAPQALTINRTKKEQWLESLMRALRRASAAVLIGSVAAMMLYADALGQPCPIPTFADAVALTAESAPSTYAVATGDFNGDGKPDLAVVNTGSGSLNLSDRGVWVLLGNGDGSFKLAAKYAAGSYPYSIAVGDFNRDGKPDLAVGNFANSSGGCSSSGVSVLLGNGDGTFQGAVNYSLPASARWVAVGDFNGDSKPDHAVAMDCSQNTVAILLGSGDGTFQSAVSYPGTTPSAAVVVGDFNGDAKLDLITANPVFNGGTISLWNGNGDGTFRAVTNFSVGVNPITALAGDFNNDGKLDVAVANLGSLANGYTDSSVSVVLGNGDGTFQSATNYDVAGFGARAVAAADFNRDGKTDLAVVTSTDGTRSDSQICVLLGNADGTFQPAASFSVGQSRPISLAAADFNVDGSADLAVAVTEFQPASGYVPGYISVLLNACVSTSPLISIAQAAGTITISWPTNAIGFQLESATDFVVSNAWSTVTNPIVTVGDQNMVTVSIDRTRRFFRLKSHP